MIIEHTTRDRRDWIQQGNRRRKWRHWNDAAGKWWPEWVWVEEVERRWCSRRQHGCRVPATCCAGATAEWTYGAKRLLLNLYAEVPVLRGSEPHPDMVVNAALGWVHACTRTPWQLSTDAAVSTQQQGQLPALALNLNLMLLSALLETDNIVPQVLDRDRSMERNRDHRLLA